MHWLQKKQSKTDRMLAQREGEWVLSQQARSKKAILSPSPLLMLNKSTIYDDSLPKTNSKKKKKIFITKLDDLCTDGQTVMLSNIELVFVSYNSL
jgi:hypothetical protein